MSGQLQSRPVDFYALKGGIKKRKSWNHILEGCIFSPSELLTLSKPQRRSIYTSSLEAHVDSLIAQLLGAGFWPVALEDYEYRCLNPKIAKGVVATLQHKANSSKQKLEELKQANENLMGILQDNSYLDSLNNKLSEVPFGSTMLPAFAVPSPGQNSGSTGMRDWEKPERVGA